MIQNLLIIIKPSFFSYKVFHHCQNFRNLKFSKLLSIQTFFLFDPRLTDPYESPKLSTFFFNKTFQHLTKISEILGFKFFLSSQTFFLRVPRLTDHNETQFFFPTAFSNTWQKYQVSSFSKF